MGEARLRGEHVYLRTVSSICNQPCETHDLTCTLRESYPPYGFFILNRVGPKDYVQRLYPEDDLGAHGNYLMLRSYPDFTARRLAQAQAQGKGRSPEPSQNKFSSVFAISNPEKLLDSEKGRSVTVGLWMFATDAREPMIDVMMR